MAKTYVSATINGESSEFLCETQQTLLDVLRDVIGLTGSKEGCASGDCGACSVIMDDRLVCSCLVLGVEAEGKTITTIEGLSPDKSQAVQRAWVELDVPQCGYCQSGQIMSATALLKTNPAPSDADIDAAMAGNLCRCGTYPRIRKAIHRAAQLLAPELPT